MELEYRMYGLVPYNLSPIQQGIQFGHAVVEYMQHYPKDERLFPETKKWAEENKTFMILNGGTTNLGLNNRKEGTLNIHKKTLREFGVKYATFHEPDLGDQLTAVVFLVDERVWDEEKYPSPLEDYTSEWIKNTDINNRNIDEQEFVLLVNNMGGQEIWEFRKFLKQFRLA